MFKLSGAALIITACTYYGFYLSSNLYMRTRIIQSLITALHYIKAQIGYASSTLPDIFRDLSVNSDNCYVQEMFSYAAKTLSDEGIVTYEAVWEVAVNVLNRRKILKKDELNVMYELSHFNSYIDKNMQVQNLELSIERLKRINENVAMDIAPRMKICCYSTNPADFHSRCNGYCTENENLQDWWNNSRSVYSNNADMNTA